MSEPLIVNGVALVADRFATLYWPERKTLIVSDLHLEKGSAFAVRGIMLPPFDSRETLARLQAAIEFRQPDRVICLGDSFHDQAGVERLDPGCRERLTTLMQGRDWVWITGNHDADRAAYLGGEAMEELRESALTFRHEPLDGPAPGEVAGHLHPKARVMTKARSVSGPCFIADRQRLILPAFGAFTGGLDIGDAEFKRRFPKPHTLYLLATERVWKIPSTALKKSSRRS